MRNITAICGGVGGAKLALGLSAQDIDLAIIVNTGDDFRHYGLPICPDLDTVAYTLSGKVHPDQGWGRAEERFSVREELDALGEDQWFLLGDRDIALHLLRSRLMEGGTLTEAMGVIGERLGVGARLLPMSDDPAPTIIETQAGERLPFQDYFVRLRCEPPIAAIHYGGSRSTAAPDALDALTSHELDGIVICPSNPLLSIAPILEIAPLRTALESRSVPAVAVSPLVGGRAIKGPTAKLYKELGRDAGVAEIARFYRGLVDILVIDEMDRDRAAEVEAEGMRVAITDTLMRDRADKDRLAAFCLDLIG